MNYTQEQIYINHNSGIWAMYKFLSSYLKYGYKFEVSQRAIIDLSSFYSQHIALGSVKHKKLGNYPFLAFSSEAFSFLGLISWNRVSFCVDNSRLYLISSQVKGDSSKWPDIAPFAVSFYIENQERIDYLLSAKKIDIKSYSFLSDSEEITVNHKNKITLPLSEIENESLILKAHELDGNDYFDILSKQINENIAKYDNYIPDFEGDLYETADSIDMKKKGFYKTDNVEKGSNIIRGVDNE